MGILHNVVYATGELPKSYILTLCSIYFGQVNQNKTIYNEVHQTNIFCFYRKWKKQVKNND